MPISIHRLSKSRFIAGLKCERRLWMLVNRPTDARDPTLAEERRMQFGIDFGRDVTKLFPGGGLEMAQHKDFSVATDVDVYFCDPRSPWQRGTNENTSKPTPMGSRSETEPPPLATVGMRFSGVAGGGPCGVACDGRWGGFSALHRSRRSPRSFRPRRSGR